MSAGLYHGTRRGFARGGLLLPNVETGTTPNHGASDSGVWPGRGEHVYVTTDVGIAWAFAQAAAGRGAPKVLEVEAWGELTADLSTNDGEPLPDCYCVPAAKVLRVMKVPALEWEGC